MKLVNLGAVLILAVCSACSYPQGKVVRGDERPSIAVEGAPETAVLEVDGIVHGNAEDFNGDPKVLLIESGTHTVRVLDGDEVLLSQEVYVSSGETRVLTLKRK